MLTSTSPATVPLFRTQTRTSNFAGPQANGPGQYVPDPLTDWGWAAGAATADRASASPATISGSVLRVRTMVLIPPLAVMEGSAAKGSWAALAVPVRAMSHGAVGQSVGESQEKA